MQQFISIDSVFSDSDGSRSKPSSAPSIEPCSCYASFASLRLSGSGDGQPVAGLQLIALESPRGELQRADGLAAGAEAVPGTQMTDDLYHAITARRRH